MHINLTELDLKVYPEQRFAIAYPPQRSIPREGV